MPDLVDPEGWRPPAPRSSSSPYMVPPMGRAGGRGARRRDLALAQVGGDDQDPTRGHDPSDLLEGQRAGPGGADAAPSRTPPLPKPRRAGTAGPSGHRRRRAGPSACSRAWRSICGERSTPMEWAPRSARYRATCPGPHPRSRTGPVAGPQPHGLIQDRPIHGQLVEVVAEGGDVIGRHGVVGHPHRFRVECFPVPLPSHRFDRCPVELLVLGDGLPPLAPPLATDQYP